MYHPHLPPSLSSCIVPFSFFLFFFLFPLFDDILILWPSSAHVRIHPLSALCARFLSSPAGEISGVTVGTVCDLWLTWSGPLSGAGKALCAAAPVWMTMGNQSHYAPQPRPSHSGHCRLHLAPWFMDAILAPERDMKGSLEVKGVEAAVSKASVCTRPNIILKGTWRRCALCVFVSAVARACVCARVNRKLSFIILSGVFCADIDSVCCGGRGAGVLTLKLRIRMNSTVSSASRQWCSLRKRNNQKAGIHSSSLLHSWIIAMCISGDKMLLGRII